MIMRLDRLQAEIPPPSTPDPVGAAVVQELLGDALRRREQKRRGLLRRR